MGSATVLPPLESPRGGSGTPRGSARGYKSGMMENGDKMAMGSGGGGLNKFNSRRGTERETPGEESDLRRLRRENAELQEELSRVQQSPRDDDVTQVQTRKVEDRIIQLRLECNRQKTLHKQKLKQVESLRGKMNVAGMETEPESERAVPFTMKKQDAGKENSALPEDENAMLEATVRILEEKGTCRQAAPPTFTPGLALRQHYEELVRSVADMEAGIFAVNYQKRTLQQIISRLSAERQGMEAFYINLKANLGGVSRQQEEQELNIKQLQHTEEATRARIDTLHEEVAQIRRRREELIGQQRSKLTKQKQLERYMGTRDGRRLELISEIQGDLNAAEEARMRKESKEQAGQRAGQVMTLHHLEKVEAAFKKMADRTGETDLNEILKRMIYLDSVNKGLDDSRVEAEGKLEELNQEQESLAVGLSGMQLNGMDMSHRRQQLTDLERNLDDAEVRAEEHKTEYARYISVLAPLQLGLDLIDSKLDQFMVPTDHASAIVGPMDGDAAAPADGETTAEAAQREVGEELGDAAVDEDRLVKSFNKIEHRLIALLEVDGMKELMEMREERRNAMNAMYGSGRPTPRQPTIAEGAEGGEEEAAAEEEGGEAEAAAAAADEGGEAAAAEGEAAAAEGGEAAAAEGDAAAAAAAEGGEGGAQAEGEVEAAAPAPAPEPEPEAPAEPEEPPTEEALLNARYDAMPRPSHGVVSGLAGANNFRVQLRSNTPALSDKAEDDDDDDDVDETEIEALLDNTDISLTHHLAKQAILVQAERRAKKKGGVGFAAKREPTPPASSKRGGGGRSGRYAK